MFCIVEFKYEILFEIMLFNDVIEFGIIIRELIGYSLINRVFCVYFFFVINYFIFLDVLYGSDLKINIVIGGLR